MAPSCMIRNRRFIHKRHVGCRMFVLFCAYVLQLLLLLGKIPAMLMQAIVGGQGECPVQDGQRAFVQVTSHLSSRGCFYIVEVCARAYRAF